MSECIFCAIAANQAPQFRVWDDEHAVAFMDINPAVEGHTLVIPRRHARDLWDIEPADAQAVMAAAVTVGGMLKAALEPDGLNIVHATGRAAFQSVFHFHLHLIPRRYGDPIRPPWSLEERNGDRTALAAVAERIRGAAG
ncbi:MAG TPA: HIT domain-containing protein [Actinomycetota bacterium]|nr:HIT domain-containing protein [Actinomycetota bacterium]